MVGSKGHHNNLISIRKGVSVCRRKRLFYIKKLDGKVMSPPLFLNMGCEQKPFSNFSFHFKSHRQYFHFKLPK